MNECTIVYDDQVEFGKDRGHATVNCYGHTGY